MVKKCSGLIRKVVQGGYAICSKGFGKVRKSSGKGWDILLVNCNRLFFVNKYLYCSKIELSSYYLRKLKKNV